MYRNIRSYLLCSLCALLMLSACSTVSVDNESTSDVSVTSSLAVSESDVSVMSSQASSATSRPCDPDNIDAELALKLREDYLQYLISNHGSTVAKLERIWVQKYYGNYSGCEIVYMGSYMDYLDVIRDVEIAGYVITFGSSQEVYAYKNSEFYTLLEAYDADLITSSDVYDIGKQVDIEFEEKNPNP